MSIASMLALPQQHAMVVLTSPKDIAARLASGLAASFGIAIPTPPYRKALQRHRRGSPSTALRMAAVWGFAGQGKPE
jgi:hypothetical protein